MSIKVKGFLQDVGGASRVTKLREENFAKGSTVIDPKDPIRELADKLHTITYEILTSVSRRVQRIYFYE